MSRPANVTVPPSGRRIPRRQLKNVVFPAPFGPMSPTASPGSTVSDTASSAVIPAKCFVIPSASRRAIRSHPTCPRSNRRGRARRLDRGQVGWDLMALLEAEGITKHFAGITALDAVSLTVEPGEAVGLIGPNGAGKTTFFNCLLGILRPDGGTVTLAGRDITRLPTYRRARLGFGRTFQRMELFAGMTVRDHLLVAERSRLGTGRFWKDLLNLSRPTASEQERAEHTLELLGLADVADRPVEALTLGRGRLVEVGRALMTEPKLLLLDEPSSGLDAHETEALAVTLRDVQAARGTAVLLVEHDVEFVRTFATRLYVLDFGTLIAQGTTTEVLTADTVRRAYLGETV